LAKSIFETGDCPICRASIFSPDDEILFAHAAAGEKGSRYHVPCSMVQDDGEIVDGQDERWRTIRPTAGWHATKVKWVTTSGKMPKMIAGYELWVHDSEE
jgi:hypothetical protein